ncbi:aromatic-ring-hydroxylating dioxygenase subunit beta [Streptomyces acidicola]|uniref:aromatic-ring-hydroxylating dioxygenase subunit beta n=1 Tax=Streptomyces acidicola TaxID=2596892 RepID=UPI003827E6C6
MTTPTATDLIAQATDPQGPRIPSNHPTYARIHDFLLDEARLLDENRLEEWLTLLHPDLLYIAPVRRTRLRSEGNEIDPLSRHFDENHSSLTARIRRLQGDSAYADDPPSRTQRNIANLTVHQTDQPHTYTATHNLTLYRNRHDTPTHDILTATRHDTVHHNTTTDQLLLIQRIIILNQTTLGTNNLAIFL